jgi:hypothetical protein
MGTLSDFKGIVAEFMKDFGTEAVLIVPTLAGEYDPADSTFTPTSSKRYKVKAIFMDLQKPLNGLKVDPNSLIQAGDKEVYIQSIANELPLPTIQPNKDSLKIGTDVWRIIALKDINPTMSDSVLLQLYIRK